MIKYIALAFFIPLIAAEASTKAQFYPLTRKGDIPAIVPYKEGQDVFIDCISRNIDNGEHNFDSNDRIIYTAFPTCKETGKPLSFHYGVSEDIECSIVFSDELYHMFQLYVHEDVPFSCRIPLSTEANYLELGGAYIPLTFNLRGEVHNSHLDMDSNVNLIITKPSNKIPEQQTVVSAIAWSSGTNATRVTIGETVKLLLAVRWFDHLQNVGSLAGAGASESLPYADGFYKLPLNVLNVTYQSYFFTMALISVVSALVTGLICSRLKKGSSRQPIDAESAYSKID